MSLPPLCKESTVEERRDMYLEAFHNCKSCPSKKALFTKDNSALLKTFGWANIIGLFLGTVGGAGAGIPLGPPGMIIGAGTGALFGVTVANATGGAIAISSYQNWKQKLVTGKFIQKLIEFHKDHEELSGFICEFTQEPFINPVVTKYGHTYEREWIVAWITKKEAELKDVENPDWHVTDPKRNGRLTLDDLKIDYKTIVKMEAVYSQILAGDIQMKEIPNPIKKGLKAIKKDLDQHILFGLKLAKKCHLEDLIKKKISEKEFADLESEIVRIKIALKDFIKV